MGVLVKVSEIVSILVTWRRPREEKVGITDDIRTCSGNDNRECKLVIRYLCSGKSEHTGTVSSKGLPYERMKKERVESL